jgi:hypothetical protein
LRMKPASSMSVTGSTGKVPSGFSVILPRSWLRSRFWVAWSLP